QETAATSEPLDLAPEATEAAVPGAEKGITEFAITESASAQADEWVDIDVEEHRLADEPPARHAPEARDLFAEELEAHAPAAWSVTPEAHASEPTDTTAPPAFEHSEDFTE